MIKIVLLIEQSRPDQDILGHSAVHALAEPEGRRVVLLCVINRLQRLRADPFHVPEMKEFVRRGADEPVEAFSKIVLWQSDCRAIRVLHPATAGRFSEMINKQIAMEWAILH